MFGISEKSYSAQNLSKKVFVRQMYLLLALLFCVHGKHLRSCRDGQLT